MKFECAQTIVIADTKCLKINTISCILMIRPAQTSVLAPNKENLVHGAMVWRSNYGFSIIFGYIFNSGKYSYLYDTHDYSFKQRKNTYLSMHWMYFVLNIFSISFEHSDHFCMLEFLLLHMCLINSVAQSKVLALKSYILLQ